VDRKGVEPFTRGLQDDAVHRHSAPGVNAGSGGFEPPRVGSEPTMLPGCISSHQWFGPPPRAGRTAERLPGIELGCSPWRGDALPLCYSRVVVRESKVLRRPCGTRTRELQVEGLARSPLLQRSMSLTVRGPRVERGGSCSQSRRVDRLPHPGRVPWRKVLRTGHDAVHCGFFNVQMRPKSARRGGRTRTHYLRCWRPACKTGCTSPLWRASKGVAVQRKTAQFRCPGGRRRH
jgi:hypothetical protein